MIGKRDITVAPDFERTSSVTIALLQGFALFAGVPPADCATIISVSRVKHLLHRETLFSVGDPVEQVLLLLSGSAKVTLIGFNGSEVILTVRGAGDLLGTLDLRQHSQHIASAQTLQPSTAIVWDSSTFGKLLKQFTVLGENIVHVLERRLDEMQRRFQELSTESVPARLSSELVRLSSRFGNDTNDNGEIHVSQAELAQLTGTTLSTVNRLLGHWEKLGMVSVHREAVRVLDLAALAQFSQME